MPHPGYFYSDDSQREKLRALLQGKLSPEQGEGGDLLTEEAGGPALVGGSGAEGDPYLFEEQELVGAAPGKNGKPADPGAPLESIKNGKPPALDPGSFGEDFKYEDPQSAEKDMVDRALGDTQKWRGGGGWEFELYDAEGDDPYVMVTNSTSGTVKRVKPGDKNPDGVDIFEAILAEKAYLEANPEVAERVKGQKPPARKPKAVTRPGDSEGEPLPPGFEPAPGQADRPLGPAEAGEEYTFRWQPPGNNPPRTETVRTDDEQGMRWARQMESSFPVKEYTFRWQPPGNNPPRTETVRTDDEQGMRWARQMESSFPVKAEAEAAPAKRPPVEVPATEVSRPMTFEPMEVVGRRPEPDVAEPMTFEPMEVVGSRSQTQTRAAPDGTRVASSPEMGTGQLSPDPEADLAESPAAMRAVRAYVLNNGGTEMDARQAEKLAAVYGLNTPRVETFLEQFAPVDEGGR